MKLKGIELNGTYKILYYYDASFEVYNEKGSMIYYENSNGYWAKYEYNEKGNMIYFKDSNSYWEKNEYDEKGKRIYFENSNGEIIDEREELTIEQIEKILGYKIKIKG